MGLYLLENWRIEYLKSLPDIRINKGAKKYLAPSFYNTLSVTTITNSLTWGPPQLAEVV